MSFGPKHDYRHLELTKVDGHVLSYFLYTEVIITAKPLSDWYFWCGKRCLSYTNVPCWTVSKELKVLKKYFSNVF